MSMPEASTIHQFGDSGSISHPARPFPWTRKAGESGFRTVCVHAPTAAELRRTWAPPEPAYQA